MNTPATVTVPSGRHEWQSEGQTLCRLGQRERGLTVLRDIGGEVGTHAVEQRQGVPLLAAHETAECGRVEFEASRLQDRMLDLKEKTLMNFGVFFEGARSMEPSGGFTPAHAATLRTAQDIVAKYK